VDGGEPPLYSEAEVSIRVRDENDNTPTFVQPPDIIRLRSADPPASLLQICWRISLKIYQHFHPFLDQ
jgi:hypothetical protein